MRPRSDAACSSRLLLLPLACTLRLDALHFSLEVALELAVLAHAKFVVLLLGKALCHLGGDLAGVREHLVLVELQEGVELRDPFGHLHRNLPIALILGVVEVHRHDALELLDLALDQVVLGDADIALEDLPLGRVLPRREPHRGLLSVSALRDQLRGGLARDRPVQLVLHGLEERLCDLGVLVVVDAALLVNVGDLQVEPSLAGADLTDPLEQLVEVVPAEALVQLQPLVVEDEPLDDELPQGLGRPDAELRCLRAVDPVADRDDRIEVVEHNVARDLAAALGSNYPDFPESCLLDQLTTSENVAEMLADGADVDAEQLSHASLVEPEGLTLIEHLDAHGVIGGAVEDQLPFLRGRGTHVALRGRRWSSHQTATLTKGSSCPVEGTRLARIRCSVATSGPR